MTNRKLIRPSLSEMRDREKRSRNKKRVPPEQTSAEEYYYLKQMADRTPIVVKLIDGEQLHGIIEWYDKRCIKVNRDGDPNLLVPKHAIKYIYKDEAALDGDSRP